MKKSGILQKLINGKYKYLLKDVDDFTIANFLYQPSYISMESALSFHGMIKGFTYQITSLTINKATSITINNQDFGYSKINNKLFWGWEKKENFLIASPEKAYFDYLYFASKGLRDNDLNEFDTTVLDKKILKKWCEKYNILSN